MLVQGLVHNRAKYPRGTKVVCVWHDRLDQPQEKTYRPELLEVAPANTPVNPTPSENRVS